MTQLAGMTIGQVSQLLGVPVPTLRSWQLRYGVGMPDRTPGGHRRYAEPHVQALRAFNAAVMHGIAPSAAAQALGKAPSDGQPSFSLPLLLLLDRVFAGDQRGMTVALDEAEAQLGTEQSVHSVLVPAMLEVGLREELGVVDSDVERRAIEAIRRWVARRTGTAACRPGAASVLLAVAPGSQHTLALETFGMLLERRGWPTCQLGANTPVSAMLSAARTIGAQAAVVIAHQVSRSRPAIEALQCLRSELGIRLYFAGPAFDSPRRRRDVPGTYLGTVLPDAVERVEADLLLLNVDPPPDVAG